MPNTDNNLTSARYCHDQKIEKLDSCGQNSTARRSTDLHYQMNTYVVTRSVNKKVVINEEQDQLQLPQKGQPAIWAHETNRCIWQE